MPMQSFSSNITKSANPSPFSISNRLSLSHFDIEYRRERSNKPGNFIIKLRMSTSNLDSQAQITTFFVRKTQTQVSQKPYGFYADSLKEQIELIRAGKVQEKKVITTGDGVESSVTNACTNNACKNEVRKNVFF